MIIRQQLKHVGLFHIDFLDFYIAIPIYTVRIQDNDVYVWCYIYTECTCKAQRLPGALNRTLPNLTNFASIHYFLCTASITARVRCAKLVASNQVHCSKK